MNRGGAAALRAEEGAELRRRDAREEGGEVRAVELEGARELVRQVPHRLDELHADARRYIMMHPSRHDPSRHEL